MAEALVAGAVLSAVFNVLFDKMASREVLDFFKQRKLNDKLLQKLKTRMNTVNGLLSDAEEKQNTSPAMKNWLDDLKDIAYEADDFMDEIAYRAHEKLMKVEATSPRTCSDQLRNFLSSLNPCKKGMEVMQPRLEEIIDRVEDLLKQTKTLGLVAQVGKSSDHASSSSSQDRRTTSRLVDPVVYGRHNEKDAIIRLLLSDDAKGKHPGVISIVGMGGLGKTTLAQLVYNDNQVKQRFDDKHRAWVCVSEESDIFKVTKDILKEFGVSNCDSLTPNQLQSKLEEIVRGERVLLVLDDIWNERAPWKRFLAQFSSAKEGSKVLITTRFEQVALAMSSVPSHQLELLNKDDCWQLFAHHAFDGGVADAYGELEEIGKKIAEKCKGLPLAATTLGGLLNGKKNAREWESILKSNMWDMRNGDIIPALRLSYHYLPSHLKQCFVYCAVFPKDFNFKKQELVLLWMAEGFIVQTDKSRDMEEIGNEYFEELARRSFFFLFKESEYDGERIFVMHDLVNDLAKSIAGELFYNLEDVDKREPGRRTRHLFYMNDGSNPWEHQLKGLWEARILRTLIYSGDGQSPNFLSRFGRLRVLAFFLEVMEDDDARNNFSGFVGTLRYLRYMRLRWSPIQSLPEDVASLCYLQTLILEDCNKLTVLPDSIGKLKKLRHFRLESTKIEVLPDSIGNLEELRHFRVVRTRIEVLPDSIGNLKELRHFRLVETRIEVLPGSIGNLKELRHLEVNRSPIKQLPESICGLHKLQTLKLYECRNLVELPDKKTDLINLCSLDLKGTDLKYMPVGMGKLVKLQNLTDFVVGEQQRGSGLGELGELRNLQGGLRLQNLENVVDEGDALRANLKEKKGLRELWYQWKNSEDEVVSDGSLEGSVLLLQHLQPHINVERIRVSGFRGTRFPDWVGDSSYSNLVSLELIGCRHCTHLPPVGQLPFLEKLEIYGFECVVSVGAEFFYVTGRSCKSSIQQPFQSLKHLSFTSMPRWEEWISDDPRHDEGQGSRRRAFPILERLQLSGCPQLRRVNHMFLPSLVDLELFECPCMVAFPNHLSLPSLVDLDLTDCSSSLLLDWGLDKLSSLSSLKLHRIHDVESFPGRISLPSSLSQISIWGLYNLKSLDYSGLQHLKKLEIRKCPKLQCIPEEGLPSSLSFLRIEDCPVLQRRCQRGDGEDWPKISHIPRLRIPSP